MIIILSIVKTKLFKFTGQLVGGPSFEDIGKNVRSVIVNHIRNIQYFNQTIDIHSLRELVAISDPGQTGIKKDSMTPVTNSHDFTIGVNKLELVLVLVVVLVLTFEVRIILC